MKIAVVYSLPSARMLATQYASADEDTRVIAEMVVKGLVARGHEASLHPISETEICAIASIRTECVFNLIEWCGLDITLSERAFAELRALDIPVTGARETEFVLTGDKIRMKKALQSTGVSTPWGVGVGRSADIPDKIPYPVIVKPHLEHCSIGLSRTAVAHSRAKLVRVVERQIRDYQQEVLVEEFVPGRELLVYLVEVSGEAKLLPVVEMKFGDDDPMAFQTYESKWVEGSSDYNQTGYERAKLTQDEYRLLEDNCRRAFSQIGLWGYARFDIRLREGIPYILETNANPSVYDATEEIGDIEAEVIEGIRFPDYLQTIVDAAIWHYERGERV